MGMENAAAIALSRQMILRQQMDVIANNVANAETTGYKSEDLRFVEYLASTPQGDKMAYVEAKEIIRNLDDGSFATTKNDLDLAISGEGYLVVETPDGPRYTRNGRLTTNAEGQIVNNAGYPVMGSNNTPITIPADTVEIEIAPDGTISVAQIGLDGGLLNQAGDVGKIQVVHFENRQAMEKVGNGLFETTEAPQPYTEELGTTVVSVMQGMIEESNVQPILEMTKMIHTHRAYQSAQKMLDTEHQLEMQAIDKLTRSV